ncbi:hypothetical protein COCC4DRAFT_31402 [Bipolaris maydis ATCC 48331]|uniref:Uncharacterized protein n=2 Tax=Cochliobolus heterostrophus TaxID=5016 RepID=M2U0D8_COCH5|nr:uncharacterized protein COCC4DRAFT_31402 [Bipolaris maydis ATCC 48331]EMD87536.1 hypothetical protein COCHEDRAFT_1023597 [Bipolaris maydis C5]ENI06736.1 hypothetical protein COCC4DRAFT_31402 [Bipolaris maydis ATCC 48331]
MPSGTKVKSLGFAACFHRVRMTIKIINDSGDTAPHPVTSNFRSSTDSFPSIIDYLDLRPGLSAY